MNSSTQIILDVGGHEIKSNNTARVIGIMFDAELPWTTLAEKKSARMLHGLKHLRRNLYH